MFVCLVLCANYGFAQQYYPQNPAYVPQVVSPQQTTVVTSTAQASDGWRAVNPQAPPLVPVPPVPPIGLPPIHEWRNGVREEWRTIHEIRPVPTYEYAGDGDVRYQQPQQWIVPQAQTWYTPQQQVIVPQTYYPQQTCYPQQQSWILPRGCWSRY